MPYDELEERDDHYSPEEERGPRRWSRTEHGGGQTAFHTLPHIATKKTSREPPQKGGKSPLTQGQEKPDQVRAS